MASFPPFKKSLLRIITVITIICLLVISCTIPASAYSNEQFPNDSSFPRVNLPCSRPQLTDGCVYAEVLTKQGKTFYVDLIVINVSTYVGKNFNVIASYDNINSLTFYINYDEEILDSISGNIDSINPQCTVYRYSSLDGKLKFSRYFHFNNSTDNSVSFSYTYGYSIYGVHYYGMNFTNGAVPDFQVEFVVTYAGEGLVLNYLEYFQYTFTRSLDILNQSISALDFKFQNFSEECIMYLNAQLSHLTNMESYLETLTEQNNQMINGPPGSDEEASPPPNVVAPPRDDSTIDDIKEAEKDAVGGKTDEEIKEDIEDTLDFEDKKDEVNGEEIETSDIEVSHNTFNLVFDFMGGAWNSYFILSLTIAFAAFLIGRRY